MKLKKQIKNRVVSVAILAVVLFSTFSLSKPQVALASGSCSIDVTSLTNSTRKPQVDSNGVKKHRVLYSQWNSGDSSTVLCFYTPYTSELSVNDAKIYLCVIGKGGLKTPKVSAVWDDGSTYNYDATNLGTVTSGLDSYSCYLLYGQTGGFVKVGYTALSYSITSEEWSSLWSENKSTEKVLLAYIKKYLSDPDSFTYISNGTDEMDNLPNGSIDSPYKKENFGYPQIYNSTYIHNDPNNLETLDKLYSGQDFQWKKKTTTGFDLTNNDYNYTYIECKVKANYQYNDKFSGKGSWHDFASYGEMGNLGKVRAESLSHYYTFQEFQEALPKTSNELPDHKMRAIKSSAVYYFRVVCMKTNSTVVIPDEKDCKYYAGPWRSVTVTKINGKDGKSVIEDGEFDENGEWKKDDDSGDNGKDIDNGSAEGDDLSDASDKAHETINSNANKTTLDLDNAKAFINQVADVPKMIADIFSFLPDWVKYSFAFGFALIPILIIFKLIRG